MSETLSDNLGQNYIQIQDKKDGYRKGKTKISDHLPPNIPGQNIGEKINIYNLAKKDGPRKGKHNSYTTPPPLPQIYRARIVLQKFIYIPGQKGWLYLGENEKT